MKTRYCARCGRVVRPEAYRVDEDRGKLVYHGKCYRDFIIEEEKRLESLPYYDRHLRLVK